MKLLVALIAAFGGMNGATMYGVVDIGPASAFVPNGSIATNLGVLPGGGWSAAYGSNAAGEVVGYGDTAVPGQFLGFTWTQSAGMSALSTLGGLDSWAMAVNDSGEVAGNSIGLDGYVHAVTWNGGQITDLGTLGGTSSSASGINNAGLVVGSGDVGDASHAFIYGGSQPMTDLNSLIAGNSGWVLNSATSINNNGEILGLGTYNGANRMFELDPDSCIQASDPVAAPEPSTITFLAIGLLLAASRATIKGGWRKSANRTKNGSGN